MSQIGLVEVDPASVPTPPTGAQTIFLANDTHVLSVKDDAGTVTPLAGTSGLPVGGVLTGTLPNPGLASTTVVGGAYGDASHIVTLTVGADGRLTAATTVAVSIAESNLVLTDITTDNVSITKHGFAPKAPNDATKFLDGTGAFSTPAGSAPGGAAGGVLGGTYPNPSLGTFTSANLSAALSDETGSGAAVFATSPTLVTPALGTPSALVLTNATGLPAGSISSGQVALARGGTHADLSATGGAHKFLAQVTTGADVTVVQPTELDIAAATHDAGNTSTALTIDWSLGTQQKCTATGSATITHSNMIAGKVYTLEYYTGAGSFTAAFASTNYAGGVAPVLTLTASKVDVFTFCELASGTIVGAIYGQSFAP